MLCSRTPPSAVAKTELCTKFDAYCIRIWSKQLPNDKSDDASPCLGKARRGKRARAHVCGEKCCGCVWCGERCCIQTLHRHPMPSKHASVSQNSISQWLFLFPTIPLPWPGRNFTLNLTQKLRNNFEVSRFQNDKSDGKAHAHHTNPCHALAWLGEAREGEQTYAHVWRKKLHPNSVRHAPQCNPNTPLLLKI